MATVEGNASRIRRLSKEAGLSDDDLIDACKYIVAVQSKIDTRRLSEALKEHAETQKDTRERLMDNIKSGMLKG